VVGRSCPAPARPAYTRPVLATRPATRPAPTAPPVRHGAVPGFRPSKDGFHFANRFPHAAALRIPLGPLGQLSVGDVADGLCGGMALEVRDAWREGRLPPEDRVAPAPDSPLFRRLVHQQVESLDMLRVPLRYFSLQVFRPERPGPFSRLLGRRSRSAETVHESRRIRAEIDAGRLPLIGILRVTGANPFDLVRHHQALAYAWESERDRLRLWIYDPNHPDDDDVELRLRLGVDRRGPATMLQTTGEPVVAFFLLG
jgi:hypothetical protein